MKSSIIEVLISKSLFSIFYFPFVLYNTLLYIPKPLFYKHIPVQILLCICSTSPAHSISLFRMFCEPNNSFSKSFLIPGWCNNPSTDLFLLYQHPPRPRINYWNACRQGWQHFSWTGSFKQWIIFKCDQSSIGIL